MISINSCISYHLSVEKKDDKIHLIPSYMLHTLLWQLNLSPLSSQLSRAHSPFVPLADTSIRDLRQSSYSAGIIPNGPSCPNGRFITGEYSLVYSAQYIIRTVHRKVYLRRGNMSQKSATKLRNILFTS